MARDKARNVEWGSANRPKISNKLGIPHRSEGSDGDIQIRQTNLGAKLFGKIGGRWSSTFLSNEEEIVGTSGTRIGMDSSGALTVDQIKLTGKITLTSSRPAFAKENVCIGVNNADVGLRNISIGVGAGKSLESGCQDNVCIGSNAGNEFTDNDNNVYVGAGCGNGATGDSNVGIGQGVCQNLENSDGNVCLGFGSGNGLTTGESCISIGYLTQTGNNVDNGICIGALSRATGDYGIAIGTNVSAATMDCVIGKSGAGNYITVDFDADATWDYSSDVRMKRNIQDDTLGLSFINDLKTKTFQWKPSEEFPEEWENYTIDDDDNKVYPEMHDRVMHGMIAQEVKSALDTANVDTFSGWSEDEKGVQQLGVASFVMPLIKAVQELSAKVDAMQVEINNLN